MAKHAKGFGDYVRGTQERPHRVPYTIIIDEKRVCAECTYPVVGVDKQR